MDISALMIFIIGVLLLPLVFVRMIDINSIRKKPSLMIVFSGFFVLIGFMTAFFIFSSALSIAIVAFSSLLILPFVIKILESEKPEYRTRARKDLYEWFNPSNISSILKRHNSLIKFYMFLFFGMALIYALLFTVLAPDIMNAAFSQQLGIFGPGGRFFSPGVFSQITENNLQILLISFVLSVFYGAGSILILNYNASIAGVMYGSPFRTLLWGTPTLFSNILLYIPHTVIEISAYLLAAVAGGILVSGLRREAIKDALILFTISVVLILIAGVVETAVVA